MGTETDSEGHGKFIKFQLLQKKITLIKNTDLNFSVKTLKQEGTQTTRRSPPWGTEKRIFCFVNSMGWEQHFMSPIQTDRQT